MLVAGGLVIAQVGIGAIDAVLEVSFEPVLEVVAGELFEQHGRQPERDARVALEELALADDREDGQVGLSRRLVKPILAVGPEPVAKHVREMPVKNQTEAADRHGASFSLKFVSITTKARRHKGKRHQKGIAQIQGLHRYGFFCFSICAIP